MFMLGYLGGGIGHRATHQAAPAVSSEELVDETVDREESDGANLEGGNGFQDGDVGFDGVEIDPEIEEEENQGEEDEEDEEDEDERYDYGYVDEDEDEDEGDEVMEEIGDGKDDENEIETPGGVNCGSGLRLRIGDFGIGHWCSVGLYAGAARHLCPLNFQRKIKAWRRQRIALAPFSFLPATGC